MSKRPSKAQAQKAIETFLSRVIGEHPPVHLIHDGESHWAFWILEEDTTSYVHPDLKIEWYGTSWDSAQDDGEIKA